MNDNRTTRTIDAAPGCAAARAALPAQAAGTWCILLCGLCLAALGCAAAVVEPPPPPGAPAPVAPPPPAPYNGPTLPKLLGIPECVEATKCCAEKVCTCLKRQFPGPGAAAPNLGEVGPQSAPAVKCAAEIIAAEAEAPQKIDALRYLGKVGCTKCYPCVEEGLLAALDDCTEVVRYEAAKAIRATATEQCKCCQCTSCCTQKIFEKLWKVAYETDSRGCPVECSPRVRRVARQALCYCGGPMVSEEDLEEPPPTEGPSGAPPVATPPAAPVPAATPTEPPPTTAASSTRPTQPVAMPAVMPAAPATLPTPPPPASTNAATQTAVIRDATPTAPAAAIRVQIPPSATPAPSMPSDPKSATSSSNATPPESATPIDTQSTLPTAFKNDPPLKSATTPPAESINPADHPTLTLRPAGTARVRIVGSTLAAPCESCGTKPLAGSPSTNPLR